MRGHPEKKAGATYLFVRAKGSRPASGSQGRCSAGDAIAEAVFTAASITLIPRALLVVVVVLVAAVVVVVVVVSLAGSGSRLHARVHL